jgi:hypothetical protein
MQKNIYKQPQLSVQCVENINHQLGNVYFVTKYHAKIVLEQEIIMKEIIEEVLLFFI